MEAVIEYFTNIPSSHRTLFLVSGIAAFWLLESAVPLFRHAYGKWRHAGINLFFTLTTVLVNFLLAFILVATSAWVVTNEFGLMQWSGLPLIVNAVVGLMVLDLIGAYLAHWVQHRTPVLWRFHLIHHTDRHLDTTSANRHHPGESVVRFAFTTLAVLVVGAPIWLVFVYQSLSALLSQFNHANISVPKWVDRYLGAVIVTPNMHHVHHHYQLPLTDSNYGNIFSFWDRLLGTYAEAEENSLVYGVDTHMDDADHQSIKRMLSIPFERKRGTEQ